ncbi:glycosyltransferase [Planktomarina temperata]|nr:glycosyltransferase [Planktomarina temperata]
MFEVIGRLCAHRLLFLSENVFHKSNRFWSKKGLVIGFGYTELSAESDKSLHGFQDEDYWLFFGRATAYKGIDCLAKALPLIDKKINIVIASTGVTEAIKRQFEPHDNVTLIDRWITDPELCRLLNRSSGILLPYTDVSQSGPLYLAIGHRKPIIASNIPEFGILAKKITSIRLFLSGDNIDFANTINDHHPKVKKISIEAYNSIRSDCSWNVVAKRLMEIS